MLKNLKRALDEKGITLKAYAAVLGVSEKTAWNKIYEQSPLTYPEAKKTKTELLPEYDSDYLFKADCTSQNIPLEKFVEKSEERER